MVKTFFIIFSFSKVLKVLRTEIYNKVYAYSTSFFKRRQMKLLWHTIWAVKRWKFFYRYWYEKFFFMKTQIYVFWKLFPLLILAWTRFSEKTPALDTDYQILWLAYFVVENKGWNQLMKRLSIYIPSDLPHRPICLFDEYKGLYQFNNYTTDKNNKTERIIR